MALSHVASSTWDVSNSTVTPTTPSGTAVGDLVIISIHSKYDDAVIATDPSGWTAIGSPGVNSGRPTGNDNGNTRTKSYYRIWQSGDSMPTINPSPNNVSAAKASTYRVAAGKTFELSSEGGLADNTTGSPLLLTAASTLGLTAGDILHVDMCLNGDAPTWSTTTISATGATFGTMVTNVADASTITGTDMRFRSVHRPVSSGTASGNATVSTTLGGTTTNTVGTGLVVRIREVDPPSTPANVSAPAITFNLTANAPAVAAAATVSAPSINFNLTVPAPSISTTSDPPSIVGWRTHNSGTGSPSFLEVDVPVGTQAGDVGYAVIGYNGTSPSITVVGDSEAWTLVDGPYEQSTTHTAWLYRKVMTAGDSLLNVTWPAQRGSLTAVWVRNANLDNEVFSRAQDGSTTATTVPAITPVTDDNILINLVSIRYGVSTGPSTTESSGWTEAADHEEGRTGLVNYGGHGQYKQLTGGGGSSHAATTSTKSIAGTDHSWVIAVSGAGGGGATDKTGDDTGTATDTADLSADMTAADTGAGADTATLEAGLDAADTGAGADIAALAAALDGIDSAAGTDTASADATINAADTATAADTAVVDVTQDVADTGTAVDTATPDAALDAADTATGDDTAIVETGDFKVGTDTGTGADVAEVTSATVDAADTATGVDTATVDATEFKSASDTATGADTAEVTFAADVSDTATGTDTASVTSADITAADAGSGADTATVSTENEKVGTDTATGTDTALVTDATSDASDSATATDDATVLVLIEDFDTGSSEETVTLAALIVGDDTAGSMDTADSDATGTAQDSGTAADNATVEIFPDPPADQYEGWGLPI